MKFSQLAKIMMDEIAKNPKLGDMDIFVELVEGEEYAPIEGIESFYNVNITEQKLKTNLCFKLGDSI